MRKLIKNQFGDTIVEVMVAIIIVGLVLGSSYATASRALRTGRFAQEQTEALKLAESQVEKIKYSASQIVGVSVVGTVFDTSNTTFCVNDSFAKILPAGATYTADCKGKSGLYDQIVNYDSVNKLFKVSITWIAPTGNPANVQVAYRLYK
ncbi:MAG: hypothetical protein WCJ60_04230 [bacterium]